MRRAEFEQVPQRCMTNLLLQKSNMECCCIATDQWNGAAVDRNFTAAVSDSQSLAAFPGLE